MAVRYPWEGEHDKLHNRVDTDALILDNIFKDYEEDLQKVVKDVYTHWNVKGKLSMENMSKPISPKQRRTFEARVRGWLDSGNYVEDKHFTRKLERILERSTIRRLDYLELSTREVTSRIKIAQKGKLLKSNYQTWMDTERSVARLTNTAFTVAGDDVVMKRIGAKFMGSTLLTKMFNQATALSDQFNLALKMAMRNGANPKGLKQITKYFFSKGDYRARRILITESTRINSEAKLSGYEKAGVKWYQYISVMDSRTTDICVRHDLKVYKVDKAQIGKNMPPLHVNCRSTTKPYFVDDRSGDTPKGKVIPPVPPKAKPKPKPKTTKPKPPLTPKESEILRWGSAFHLADPLLNGVIDKHKDQFGGLYTDRSSSSAHYWSFGKTIDMKKYDVNTPEGASVYRHEYGHFLDDVIGRKKFYSGKYISAGEVFTNAMKADSKFIKGNVAKGATKKAIDLREKQDKIHYAIQTEQLAKSEKRKKDLLKSIGHSEEKFEEWYKLNIDGTDMKATIYDRERVITRKVHILQALNDKDAGNFFKYARFKDINPYNLGGDEALSRKFHMGNKSNGSMGALSDSVGATTNNIIAGRGNYYGGWGHTTSYFKRSGARQTEIFANMTASYGSGVDFEWSIFEILMPNTSAEYIKILKEFG